MDRWQQIRRIFRGALAHEGRERTAFLADACAGDDELRHQVDELLEKQGSATRFPEALSVEKVPATFSETAPRPSIGQRFAHYRIIEKRGAGGMGEVYRAHDEQLDRDVAIKLLPAASFADPTAQARLLREARAAAALNHPHICTIHEVGEAQGHTYIAMELVEGQPLSTRLEAGALPLQETVRYGLQLAEALTHAHERGVLHRDLKSANIIITPEGRLKVLDFGLATRFTAEALTAATQSHASLTEPGVLMGTLAYMAPEQLRSQVADLRSDVWAFGVVLYEMMSGAHPFRASSSADTVSIILTKDPPPLERAAPSELHRIVTKCLEKDRERRYQTMRDLLIDLENALRFSAKDAWRGYTAAGTAGAPLKAAPLPIPRTPIVGRDHERMAARSLLLRPEVRLVTFTGTGGSGKTRLALQVAAELAPEFSGRVYFVALASITDPALVIPTVAQAVGLRTIGNRDPMEVVKDVLVASPEPVLLVLDNFEHVLDAAPLVTHLLDGCANLKILVTSRAVLRMYGEYDFEVPPLVVPPPTARLSLAALSRNPAVALFVQRVTAVKPDFALTPENAAAVAEICARLDGLPLAIELAAARTRMLTPSAVLQRLESRFELLTGGARDLPARQQTLRATMEWSHELLAPEELKLFRRLSVFVNGCTLEAVEAVCLAQEDLKVDLLDAVQSLVQQSLVQQVHQPDQEPRFAMLEIVREYGLERLAASTDAALTRRAHAAYCLVLAEEGAGELAPQDLERWLARCDLELDNFRAALEWAATEGEIEWGLRLGTALNNFWRARGRPTEGRERLGRLLRLPGPASPKTRMRALKAAGDLAHVQADIPSGRALVEESLALGRNFGDAASVVQALNALAYMVRTSGEIGRARQLYEECLDLVQQAGDERAVVRALINLGQHALKYEHDPEAARALYDRALAIAERLHDRPAIAMCFSHLGDVAKARNDFRGARGPYERALAVFRDLGDHRAIVRTLIDLVDLFADQGEHDAAHQWLAQALGVAREIEDDSAVALALSAAARSAARRGQATRALRLAGAADAIHLALRTPPGHLEAAQMACDLEPARQALGPAAGTTEQEGREMSLEDATEYALREEAE
jgi:predicted ATPase